MNVDRLIAELEKNADQYEVFHMKRSSGKLTLLDGVPNDFNMLQQNVYAIRFIRDGRLAFSITQDINQAPRIVTELGEMTRAGRETGLTFHNIPMDREQADGFYNPLLDEIDQADLIEKGKEFARQIYTKFTRSLTGPHLNIFFLRFDEQVRLVNSAGTDRSYRRNLLSIGCMAELVKESGFITLYRSRVFRTPEDLDCTPMSEKVIRDLERGRTSADISTGRYRMLFSPTALAHLLRPLEAGLNGMNCARGTSPLRDRLGQRILDKRITLYDDPTIPGFHMSVPFDDEGVPTRRRCLVEKGVLRDFVHNLESANLTGAAPTGNGFRYPMPYRENQPKAATSNRVMEPGTRFLREMIEELDDGILVTSLMGPMGSIIDGDFSGKLWLGFRVRHGRICGAVKGPMLSANIYRLLGEDFLGASREIIEHPDDSPGDFLPYCLCDGVSIAC